LLFGKTCGKEEAVENIIKKEQKEPEGLYLAHRSSPIMGFVGRGTASTYLSILSRSRKRFVP
jgi:hypothetical protein